MNLTDPQFKALRWLAARGGIGYLDGHGRVNAQGEHYQQGGWKSWLFLIARGLVAGGESRLSITDAGRAHLKP